MKWASICCAWLLFLVIGEFVDRNSMLMLAPVMLMLWGIFFAVVDLGLRDA